MTTISQARFTQPTDTQTWLKETNEAALRALNSSGATDNQDSVTVAVTSTTPGNLDPFNTRTGNTQSVGLQTTGPSGPSPFFPFLEGLAQKYAPSFDLSVPQMKAMLAAILKNETGNEARFVPKDANTPYLKTGDNGNGLHAWQIDQRYHSGFNRPMTFAESGDYAVGKVLLPFYQKAKASGVSDPHIAAARQYNGGPKAMNNDSLTTNNYGARFKTAFENYSRNA